MSTHPAPCSYCGPPMICGCKRNTKGHSKPHHRHRVRCHARGEKTIEETGSTFEATTYSVPFCSTHYFARLFSEIPKCQRNVSCSICGAAPDKELLTFYGFPSVLSAINGDLSLEGKAFDLPQPEETRLSAFHFKSQIHVAFLISSTQQSRFYGLLYSFVEVLFSYADCIIHKAHLTMGELNGLLYKQRERDECLSGPCGNSELFRSKCDRNMAEACGD